MANVNPPQVLPHELECHIIELAAIQSLRTAASLMLVCRRINVWTERILYSVFCLDGTRKVFPPQWNSTGTGKIQFRDDSTLQKRGRHIRYIYILGRSAKTISKVLAKCPNVESATLSLIEGSTEPLIETLDVLPLRKLSMHTTDFLCMCTSRLPARMTVTHLELEEVYSDFNEEEHWSCVAALPKLTHLGLKGKPDPRVVEFLLRRCSSLQQLVVVWPPRKKWEMGMSCAQDLAHIKDKRLVHANAVQESPDWWTHGFTDYISLYEDDARSWRR